MGFEQYHPDTRAELVAFVTARNANRRHCTPSQLAASIAKLNEFARGGVRHGSNEPEITKGSREPLPQTQQQEADKAGIGRETVKRAAKVQKKAPELLDSVRDGKLDAKTAARAADLPAADRAEIAASADPKATAEAKLAPAGAVPEPEAADPAGRAGRGWPGGEPVLAAAWEEALEVVADGFRREAHRRAVEGVRTLVTYRGDPVFVWTTPDGSVVPAGRDGAVLAPLYEVRYSDGLLTALLKAAFPAEFRGHARVEHAGDATAPARVEAPAVELMRQDGGGAEGTTPGGGAGPRA